MAQPASDTFFDSNSEPTEQRIAVGLNKIGLALKQQSWHQANEQGVSATQAQILSSLSTSGTARASELAKQLGVTLPTVSDSLRVLAEKGLLVKERDPADARASVLTLTRAGKQLAQRASGWTEFLASAVQAMSEPEQEVFLLGLSKMIRSLQDSGQIPVQSMCMTCRYFRPDVHSGDKPHHCAFVDAPFGNRHLRLHCPEHQPIEG